MGCTRLLLSALIMVALTACAESKEPPDEATPGETTCERDGVSYEVGDVVPGDSAHASSCVCLEEGEIGRCTGLLDDAAADAGNPDAGNPDAGNLDAGPLDAGDAAEGFTGFDGTSLRCGTTESAPNGFERCETGALRRVAPSTCSSSVPRTEAIEGHSPGIDECDHDSDCSDLPLGHCARREGGSANACVAGCIEDSDCAAGRVCLCGEPVGRCIPADCTSGADCEAGFDCLLYDGPTSCLPQLLACQRPGDACAGSRGCSGHSVNPTFCIRGPESSSCSTSQCTQP